jgi:apolipoprotein N-acyltransferase
MVPRSPLYDKAFAQFAWDRYKRSMKLMAAATLVVVGIATAGLYWVNGFVSIHFYIATVLGIGATMLLTAALMGLAFLSSGTGHDDAIIDPLADERD